MGSPRMYFQYFVNLRKSVFSSILSCFYVYFGVLRVNIGGVEIPFHQYQGPKTQVPNEIRC